MKSLFPFGLSVSKPFDKLRAIGFYFMRPEPMAPAFKPSPQPSWFCHVFDAKKHNVTGYALGTYENARHALSLGQRRSHQRKFMRAIKRARRLIETQPEAAASVVLSRLVVALEAETAFDLAALYQLDYKSFELALEVLAEWRLDRYYSGKARLLGASVQLTSMSTAQLSGSPE